jgi:hypothetical protein
VAGDLDLLDEFLTTTTVPGPRCSIARALDVLTPEDRDLIIRALDHPHAVPRRIAAGIAQRLPDSTVEPPKVETVRRHRKGDCRCPRPS